MSNWFQISTRFVNLDNALDVFFKSSEEACVYFPGGHEIWVSNPDTIEQLWTRMDELAHPAKGK